MSSYELCTEEEIEVMVREFYARIRLDPKLGPIFEKHVLDWEEHLVKLIDFWSSVLLRTARFSGAPMPRHAALPGLNADLFQDWLKLFRQTTAKQPNHAMGDQAYKLAERIAQSLWYGYQVHRAMPVNALAMNHE